MIKTAIFVEGQTELIFTRECLLKMFEYQSIDIECYTLFKEGSFYPTDYSYTNLEATHHFQIVNVGNDNSVLTRLLKRESYLWSAGFTLIIGLRDMYSKAYREIAGDAKVSTEINKSFIQESREQIDIRAMKPESIIFLFAIMEIETWFLYLSSCFISIDDRLNLKFINETLNLDIVNSDLEKIFFHPTKILEDIFHSVGKNYNKSQSNINTLMSAIDKELIEELVQSKRSSSFKKFYEALPKSI